MWEKVREWWQGLFLCDINRRLKYAWLWKLLVSWNDGISVEFYPDYENRLWGFGVWWTGKEKR